MPHHNQQKPILQDSSRPLPHLGAMITPGLMRRGENVGIFGPEKSGKSFLGMQWAISMAAGQRFLGAFPSRPCQVLWLDDVLHWEQMEFRADAIGKALGIDALLSGSLRLARLRGIAPLTPRTLDGTNLEGFDAIFINARATAEVWDGVRQSIAERTRAACIWIHRGPIDSGGHVDGIIDLLPGRDGIAALQTSASSFPPRAGLKVKFEFPIWKPVQGGRKW